MKDDRPHTTPPMRAALPTAAAGMLLVSMLLPVLAQAGSSTEPELVPEPVRLVPAERNRGLDHDVQPDELLVPVPVADTSALSGVARLADASPAAAAPPSSSSGVRFRLAKQAIGAGAELNSARFRLLGTVAEVGAGESSSARFSLTGGFHPLPRGLGAAERIFCDGFEAGGCP